MNGEGRMIEDPSDDHKVLLFASRVAAARWAADAFAEAEDGFAVDEISMECWADFSQEVPYKKVSDADVFGSAEDHEDPLWAEYFKQKSIRDQSLRAGEEIDLIREAKELEAEIASMKEETAAASSEAEDLEMTLMGVWTQCQVLSKEIRSQEEVLTRRQTELGQAQATKAAQTKAVADREAAAAAAYAARQAEVEAKEAAAHAEQMRVKHEARAAAEATERAEAKAQAEGEAATAVERVRVEQEAAAAASAIAAANANAPPPAFTTTPGSADLAAPVPIPASAATTVAESDLTSHDLSVTVSAAEAGAANDAAVGERDSEGTEGDPVDALANWMVSLKIKLPIARGYAEVLVEDGFDSIDALETVDEAELIEYGVKKGHARLILKGLSNR